MDVTKEEDKQVVDMNETKECQCVSDDLWKPSIGEKLWICEEDGTVWTVGILDCIKIHIECNLILILEKMFVRP